MLIDLIPKVADEVILVSKNYLGSINHTLLSIELLKQRNLVIAGIIFNGDANIETEQIILSTTGIKCIGRVPMMNQELKSFVKEQAKKLDL